MNKDEREQFAQAWLEVENVITLIDPNFQPEKRFKRPEEAGPMEIKSLLQFLRVQVRMLLHDNESIKRENLTLSKLIEDGVNESCGG